MPDRDVPPERLFGGEAWHARRPWDDEAEGRPPSSDDGDELADPPLYPAPRLRPPAADGHGTAGAHPAADEQPPAAHQPPVADQPPTSADEQPPAADRSPAAADERPTAADERAVPDDGTAAGGTGMADAATSPVEDEATASSDDAPRARRADRKDGSFLRELPVLLLVAFVLAFLLRTFVLQVFFIPSASMEPTLMVDDRMVVEKVTYRFREPQRGEIVVFEGESETVPDDTGAVGDVARGVGQFLGVVPASARDFVKRVIGLPGDEIRIEDGLVYVNGEPLDEPYKVDEANDYGPVIVPEGRLFFLGDNRPNSSDSRRGLGMVERDHVVGRAVFILFPFSHAGGLTDVVHDVPEPASPPPEPEEVTDPDEVHDSVSSLAPLALAS